MTTDERMFPILMSSSVRACDEIKHIPWSVLEPFAGNAMKNHGQTLERLAQRGGLSAREAVAVIEGRSIGTVGSITHAAAQLRLRELVGGTTPEHVEPPSSPVIANTLADLQRGVALAQSMSRHINGGTQLKLQYDELIRIMQAASMTVRAFSHRK